ncbi:hypothetical protein C8J56DRAFT_885644 [Mycena floridula]|nr:hypothetical protein C8J56DRAFT_885644 [Mycena floridula]
MREFGVKHEIKEMIKRVKSSDRSNEIIKVGRLLPQPLTLARETSDPGRKKLGIKESDGLNGMMSRTCHFESSRPEMASSIARCRKSTTVAEQFRYECEEAQQKAHNLLEGGQYPQGQGQDNIMDVVVWVLIQEINV